MPGPFAVPAPSGIQVSDITPSYAIPHDNAIAKAIGEAGDAAQGVVNNLVKQHYEDVGRKEGAAVAAGTQPYKPHVIITDVGAARENALHQAYLAGAKTDIDQQVDDAARANPANPDAFKKTVDPIINGYVKAAPGPYAVQVEQYARQRAAAHLDKLTGDKIQHDQTVAVNGVNARQASLSDDLLAMAGGGEQDTPQYAAKLKEYQDNEAAKVANPLFTYAPEQAALANERLTDQLQGAVLTHHATVAYNAAGGGEAGKAAALAILKKEALDDGGALSTMAPGKRLKLYGVAAANVTALDKDDAERRAIKAQQDRADHQERVNSAGEYALGLQLGTENEASVKYAESKGWIEPGAAARLISGAKAMQRQQAAQARQTAALERSANYSALSDMAREGKLTADTLAANGGNLSGSQRTALYSQIDKRTAPGVKNITGLASAAFKDGGIQGAAAKMSLENLTVDAGQFMHNNPQATVGQQQKFAADWVKANHGLVIKTEKAGPAAVQTRAQYEAAYRARFHGQPVPQSDLDRGWKNYQSVHPNAK